MVSSSFKLNKQALKLSFVIFHLVFGQGFHKTIALVMRDM